MIGTAPEVLSAAPIIGFIDIDELLDLPITGVELTIDSFGEQGALGLKGPTGNGGASGGGTVTLRTVVPLGGHRMVRADITGVADYASNTYPVTGARCVGMTLGATAAGESTLVCRSGEVTEPSWAWTVNKPVFLGINGLLTQTLPSAPAAVFSLVVGYAVSATTVFINIASPIVLTP